MNGDDEVKFRRDDLVCLTETCTILKVLVEDQKTGFGKIDTRLEELSSAMKAQKKICEERFEKIEPVVVKKVEEVKLTMEQRMGGVEIRLDTLEGFKNLAVGGMVTLQALIGIFAVFRDYIIKFFGG